MSEYIETWKRRGYSDDIPDEVPHELIVLGLAPSYKAIAMAILRGDMNLISLGFSSTYSAWYDVLKREEISQREGAIVQMDIFS